MSKPTMAGLALGAALSIGSVAADGNNTDKVGQNLDQADKTMELDDITYGTKGRLSELLGQCDFNDDKKINIRSDIGKTGPDGKVITRKDVIKEVRCEQKFDHARLDKSIAELDKSIAKNKAELAVLDSELIQLRKDLLNGKRTIKEGAARMRELDEQIKNLKNSILQKISKK